MSSTKITVVGKTKAGKEIGYRMPEGANLYEICFTSGGEIPQEFKGSWNDIRQIKNAINNYLARESNKPVKAKKNSPKIIKKTK